MSNSCKNGAPSGGNFTMTINAPAFSAQLMWLVLAIPKFELRGASTTDGNGGINKCIHARRSCFEQDYTPMLVSSVH